MATLADIRLATHAARTATGYPISTRVHQGLVQVIVATPQRGGRFSVDELSDYTSSDAACELLRQIAADADDEPTGGSSA